MSEPTRIQYRSSKQVPSTAKLLAKVSRDRHLVLELLADSSRSRIDSLIARFEREMPENYVAFHAGLYQDRTWVTLKQVVSRPMVIAMEEELMGAARHFRRTATELATALAAHNHVSSDRLWEECGTLESHSAEWCLDVHGQHCRFEHLDTGQVVEISMWFGTEFGVLDPYFFHDCMQKTPCLKVPAELHDAFHDTRRAMDILRERGKLVSVTGVFNLVGLTASDEDSKE